MSCWRDPMHKGKGRVCVEYFLKLMFQPCLHVFTKVENVFLLRQLQKRRIWWLTLRRYTAIFSPGRNYPLGLLCMIHPASNLSHTIFLHINGTMTYSNTLQRLK